MRKRLVTLSVIVIATLTISTIALAGTGTDEESDVVISGTGALVAAGIGNVELHGAGWVRLAMNGDLTITDLAGDAEIVIDPARDSAAADSTTIVLEGFEGVVTIKGSRFALSASGKFRRITAKGTGWVFLQGHGWYRASGGHFGRWTPAGTRVTYNLSD